MEDDAMNVRSIPALAIRTYRKLPATSGIAALLTRLFVGGFFMSTGWGKMHNLADFATRFAQWGIPWPHFNAALSAYTYGILRRAVHRARSGDTVRVHTDDHKHDRRYRERSTEVQCLIAWRFP